MSFSTAWPQGAAGRSGGTVLISEHELSEWPRVAVAAMKQQRLITKATPATSAVCPGCEDECIRPVHVLPHPTGPVPFIICDKRSDINLQRPRRMASRHLPVPRRHPPIASGATGFGGFRCMVCGAKGGDVLAFHMQRFGLGFIDAAKALGAWGDRR